MNINAQDQALINVDKMPNIHKLLPEQAYLFGFIDGDKWHQTEYYDKGFMTALDILEDMGYCASSGHEYNIKDCVLSKVNKLTSSEIRKTSDDKRSTAYSFQQNTALMEKNAKLREALEKIQGIEAYCYSDKIRNICIEALKPKQ